MVCLLWRSRKRDALIPGVGALLFTEIAQYSSCSPFFALVRDPAMFGWKKSQVAEGASPRVRPDVTLPQYQAW